MAKHRSGVGLASTMLPKAPPRWDRERVVTPSTTISMTATGKRQALLVLSTSSSFHSTLTATTGDLLHAKLTRANEGKATHGEAHEEFRASIPSSFVEKWEAQVLEWEAQPSEGTNPFKVETTGAHHSRYSSIRRF